MASIKRLPNGRYQARFRDDARREHARNFTRKRDAQRWLDEQTTAIVSGQWADPRAGKITVQDYFDQWSARQLWKDGTRETANRVMTTVDFKGQPIGSIRRSHVEAWVKQMQTGTLDRRPFAASTIQVRYNHLHMLFRAAVRDRVIPVDPTEGVRIPRAQKSEHKMTIPTAGEVQAVTSAADPFFRPAIGLAAFAGLRRGEVAGVKIADIDFLRRTLHVVRQAPPGTGEVQPPKHGAERDVFLPDALLELLSTVTPYDGGWLLPGVDGRPPGGHMINHWWRRASKASGVRPIRVHDLRHFYASGLIAAGCDVVTVQRALGHSSPSITLDTYSHLWPSAEDRTRDAAADLMSEVADSVRTVAGRPDAD